MSPLNNEGAGRSGPPHKGPPLAVLAMVHVGLFVGSVVVLQVLGAGSWPSPGAEADVIAGFVTANQRVLREAGMLQFASAVPLLIFAATVSSRLEHLGVRAAGARIAQAGGTVAAALLALSGLAMTAMGLVDPAVGAGPTAVLHATVFVAGGVGTVVFFGLLVAGVSVTSLMVRLLPRGWCWVGLVAAGAAELSTLGLAFDVVQPLIAVGRFGGMVVLIAAGWLLPSRQLRGTTP